MPSKRLISSVIVLHLLFFLGAFFAPSNPKKIENKPLVVRTVKLKEDQKKFIAQKASPISPSVAKKTSPKKQEPQKISKSNQITSSKTPKKKPNLLPQHLIKELEESLAKIDNKPDKMASFKTTNPPRPKIALQIDRKDLLIDEKNQEAEFQQLLVDTLKAFLHLPEYGDVKMQITLRRDGSVAKCVVIKAENQKNKQYLEEMLPKIAFPQLDISDESKTFVLTFCNEI